MDFVYTSVFDTDYDSFVADLAPTEWLSTRFPALDGGVGERELVDVEALRSAIRGIAVAVADQRPAESDHIDVLNLYAATPDIPPVLAGSTRQAGRSGIRAGQALSTIAREAVRIFGEDQRERVRRCAAEDCQLVFFDDSRAGARRWCSMQRCGNRAKVRAYRERSNSVGHLDTAAPPPTR